MKRIKTTVLAAVFFIVSCASKDILPPELRIDNITSPPENLAFVFGQICTNGNAAFQNTETKELFWLKGTYKGNKYSSLFAALLPQGKYAIVAITDPIDLDGNLTRYQSQEPFVIDIQAGESYFIGSISKSWYPHLNGWFHGSHNKWHEDKYHLCIGDSPDIVAVSTYKSFSPSVTPSSKEVYIINNADFVHSLLKEAYPDFKMDDFIIAPAQVTDKKMPYYWVQKQYGY